MASRMLWCISLARLHGRRAADLCVMVWALDAVGFQTPQRGLLSVAIGKEVNADVLNLPLCSLQRGARGHRMETGTAATLLTLSGWPSPCPLVL